MMGDHCAAIPPGDASALALAWAPPIAAGCIRRRPADYRVDEELGFEPAGDGPHTLLRVEKTGRDTVEVAAMLARYAGVAVRDVGYSGLKDKHAVTTQWFSLPGGHDGNWRDLDAPGVRILSAARHRRKLRRGTHPVNHFRIRVELADANADGLAPRLERIESAGVPNYFGEQRFGRRYAENARRLAAGGKLPRVQRSLTLSAIRAALFNQVLDRRVRAGSWNIALPGEYVNLNGTRGGFPAADDDPAIPGRIAALDLHPTAPLFGGGPSPARGEAAADEEAVATAHRPWLALLATYGLKMERRAARCAVRGLAWERDDAVLSLRFSLRRGQFATSVLREVLDYRDVTRPGGGAASGGS